MAAALAELRSRPLLPEDSAAGRQARGEVTALREQAAERERMRAAAAWLDRRLQLGRDVFACGTPTIGATRRRTADLTALLRACLAALQAEVARGERYRPRPLALWRVRDAFARVQALLPELRDAAPHGDASLWCFLPDREALEAAGVGPGVTPDTALLRRSAVVSTLTAGLDLAREGRITLAQEDGFGGIAVHAVQGAPTMENAVDHWRPAKLASSNTPPSRSRRSTYGLPRRNAARATRAVSSGTGGIDCCGRSDADGAIWLRSPDRKSIQLRYRHTGRRLRQQYLAIPR
jgi:segregation and condensation protein A